MKGFRRLFSIILALTTPAFAAVSVSSPVGGSTVTSPVHYVATATTSCSKGIGSIGIYVDDKLKYSVDGKELNTELTLSAGSQHTVVKALDKCGGGSQATVNLTVVKAAEPEVTITADPSSIASGGSSTLTVIAKNATSVTVKGSDDSSYKLADEGGALQVSPKDTTKYTVTATGAGGKTSATATVTVYPAATVTITANPTSVTAGGPSTLKVTATNAIQVTVKGTDGSSYSLGDSGGDKTVYPTATTKYTATATGKVGKTSAAATVTVIPVPTVSITANPTSISPGSSSILTVTAANATGVTLTGTDGTLLPLGAAGGSTSVSPSATAVYTATATGAGGKATATATVTVTTNPPPTVSITANPTTISPGSSSILTVTAANATGVTLTGTDGTLLPLGAAGGSTSVSPSATATYTATATGAGGKATANATVTVTANPPPTVSITASPTSVAPGSSSTLTVTATNATQVVVTGTDGSSYTLADAGGNLSVSPTVPTTYTAIATGPAGKVFATVSLTVQGQSSTLYNLQTSFPAFDTFGQVPPDYVDCSPCSGIAWSVETGITSPSLSGDATEFDTWGTVAHADVLFVNPVIGANTTQGIPDTDQTIVPNLHNFTYDTDFYVTNAAITWALEFDVAQYFDTFGFFFGTQCAQLADGDWDVLNDTQNWVSTGIPCEFADGWNHLTLQFQRLSNNTLLFSSVTLNGVTSNINMTATPETVASSWYGITVCYQMDGNKAQASNTTYLDNLTLNYW